MQQTRGIWEKKKITDHLKSDKHITNKNSIEKNQEDLNKFYSNKTAIKDFVLMCAKANICLEKKDDMNDWIEKYVNLSGAIPNSNNLRSYFLPKIIEEY